MKVFPSTLKNKLRLALFLTAFFPFMLMLVYLHRLGEDKIIDDTFAVRHAQLHLVTQHIRQDIGALQKEVSFLASLEIMNDLIVKDIDQRIATLLLRKKHDLGLKLDFYAISSEGGIIVSTSKKRHARFAEVTALKQAAASGKKTFASGNVLYLFSPVTLSMESTKQYYLVAAYALDNLAHYAISQNGARLFFYFPHKALRIGRTFFGDLHQMHLYKNRDVVSDKYLILHEALGERFGDGMAVYMIEKSVALAFLERFVAFIWAGLSAGIAVMLLLSWWVANRIIKPVERLTDTTRSIIDTQNYATRVDLKAEGEIKTLTEHFNVMLAEVERTFQRLEEENRIRLKRFTELINIFNRLITTQSKSECTRTAVKALQQFLPEYRFAFSSEAPQSGQEEMLLYVHDFDRNTRSYYGKIVRAGSGMPKTDEAQFFQAITAMVVQHLDQIELIERIHSVSEAKSAFISYMSHELRTPLHTILGTTQYLIGYEPLSEKQQEKVGRIEASAGHLLGMINDILDLAQIEAGKVTAQPVACTYEKLRSLIFDAVKLAAPLAEQKSLAFECAIPERLFEGHVRLDVRYFKQILINLLSNAVKFTQEGTINVTVSFNETDVMVNVTDTGKGIKPEHLAQVFEAFTQLHKEDTKQGNGLGLAISRKLARLFDADIVLQSDGSGKGTKAVIRLKRQPPIL
jgi:signal transduction histidine kinase